MTNYENAVEYISDIPRFAPKTGLDNTRIILSELGSPQRSSKVVHVAGTNGKGSVAKMTALMLEKKGYRTGLFISPHLIRMNERISINGEEISDADFVDIYDRVMNAVLRLKDSNADFRHPAYFEFLFVMAALYFSDKKCDYVVYETGLGGRLDATNVTEPVVSIITSIGLDHMQYLGNTIEKIAGEKAGIIKTGIPVVYNTGSETADKVIEETAGNKGSDLIKAAYNSEDNNSLNVFLQEIFGDAQPLYQYDNASTAIAAFMTVMEAQNFDEVRDAVGAALKEFYWPGRMQYIAPNVIIDGAHNEDAVMKMTDSLLAVQDRVGRKGINIFFAVSSDKDYETIIRLLCQKLNIEKVYVTEINSDRREDITTVINLFRKYLPSEKQYNVVGSSDMEQMWETAKGELQKEELLLAVGSLYMAGELLEYEDGLHNLSTK